MKLFTTTLICVAALLPNLLLAQSADYTLDIDSQTITVGDTITVSWTSGSNDTNKDWIGLFVAGESNFRYQDWEYVDGASGSFDFIPEEPGTYEFRYFLNNGYTIAATSGTFEVEAGSGGGGGDYELTLSDTTIGTGDTITVSWTSGSNDTNNDWIGLFVAGESNSRYQDWKYVDGTGGSFDFVPKEPGTYEFRYFLNNGYTVAVTSDTFEVEAGSGGGGGGGDYELTLSDTTIGTGDTITVSWTSGSNDTNKDWIGLYRTGDSSRNFQQWEYVGASSGSLDFVINRTGNYEFRYYLDDGFELAATSENFSVEEGSGGGGGTSDFSVEPDKTVYSRGDIARVTWDVPAGATFFLNWIGLYEPDAPDTDYLYYEYVDFLSRVETFPLDNDGVFEFRFFTSNTFNKVATSEQIIVLNSTSTACTLNTASITNFPAPNGPIIAFGDSITFGYGASEGEDYVSELEDRLGTPIINEGVSGDTTRSALARLQTNVLSRNPSAVIVFLGGNDEIRRFYESLGNTLADRNLRDELDKLAAELGYDWMNKPLIPRDETFSNLQTIVEEIQATGAVTILVGFDAGIYDQQIDDNYQMIADDTGSFFVSDIYSGIFGRPRYMSDLVHPNDAGYDIVADRIQPSVACVI